MKGSGDRLSCRACGAEWQLTEYGFLEKLPEGNGSDPGAPTVSSESESRNFTHIPDWYRWERDCVRRELEAGSYAEEIPAEIMILRDTAALYRVGQGNLHHGVDGFHLTGCGGRLDYRQAPTASYMLNADYFWYEIGDILSIGDADQQYYCFPLDKDFPVARTRLAAEELYRLRVRRS